MLDCFANKLLRYTKSFLFMMAIAGGMGTSIMADDLKIEEFNATIVRNDIVYDASEQVGYIMNLDDLKIRVHLKSSWDGDPKPKIVPKTEISFFALLSAVGSDGSSMDIDRFAVYQDELAILAHGHLSGEEKNIDIDVTSNSAFHEWVLARLNDRNPISFHIRIDSTEEVNEDDEGNNEDEVPAALIIPITGKVGFTSALDANITSLYDMHEKNSDCPFIVNGLGTWEPGSGWTTSDVTFSGTCVEHFSNGDLKAHNNVVHAGTTSGTLADRSVTIPQTNLDPSNGAQPSADISVTLPENYTYHLMNTEEIHSQEAVQSYRCT